MTDPFAAMRTAVEGLDPVEARRFFQLGVFPEGVSVPDAIVGCLWDTDPGPTLHRLSRAGLLTSSGAQVCLDEQQRSFLLSTASEPAEPLHGLLLERLRPERGWAYLPDDEAYLWDHLLHHLEQVGDHQQMAAVVTNGRWLARRLHRHGVRRAEADIARAATSRPDDADVRQVLALLRQRPELFEGELSLSDVAATVRARLPLVEPAVTDLLGTTWLKPAWAPRGAPEALVRTFTTGEGGVAFSPDGRMLAIAGRDHSVRLCDPTSGIATRTLTGHTGAVTGLAFSSEGHLLATVGNDETARLWDPASGREIRTMHGKTSWGALALSPDGSTLATTAEDAVCLWDLATGTQTRSLTGHIGGATAVVFSPAGHLLAASGMDGRVRLWDLATCTEIRTVGDGSRPVGTVAFSPDGSTLASNGEPGAVCLWDVASGSEMKRLVGHTNTVMGIAFSPDGTMLATAGADLTVGLWDLATGSQTRSLTGHTEMVRAVAFSPDGHTLASSGHDRRVRLWDLRSATDARISPGHTNTVTGVAFSPDGLSLATTSHDQTARIWDATTGVEMRTLRGHTNRVVALSFSPDGRSLATSSYASVRLWDPGSGAETAELVGHTRSVNAVAFSADGQTLATASSHGNVRVWDLATGTAWLWDLRPTPGPRRPGFSLVNAVAFSPDGHTLAASSDEVTIHFRDVTTGIRHGSRIGTIRLRDLRFGASSRTLRGHEDHVSAIAFLPAGDIVASAGWDGTVRLWDLATGTQIRAMGGRNGRMNALAVSPDGRTLASGGADGTLRLWDSGTGAEITAMALGAPVHGCSFAPNGRAVAAVYGTELILLTIEQTIEQTIEPTTEPRTEL